MSSVKGTRPFILNKFGAENRGEFNRFLCRFTRCKDTFSNSVFNKFLLT